MSGQDTIYEIVTQQILKQLHNGVAPWRQPWRTVDNGPRSIHGHFYHGINVFLLLSQGYESPFWITFDETVRRGGHVKYGEHGTIVVLWKFIEVKDSKAPGGKKTIPLLRYHRVFNLEQTEGVEAPELPEHVEPPESKRHTLAQQIVKGMPLPPKISYRGSEAYYKPDTDSVVVPPKKAYEHADNFYSTLFHELGHATSHDSRLGRPTGTVYAGHSYGREELIAEMTAAFLSAESGIVSTQATSAAYLDAWINTIREDSRAVIVAAGAAQKAAEYILNRPKPEEV